MDCFGGRGKKAVKILAKYTQSASSDAGCKIKKITPHAVITTTTVKVLIMTE